jgi:hypothetical protein
MIWFTWRQFRTQTWITAGALALLAAALWVTAREIAAAYANANVAACGSDCASAIDNFLQEVKTGTAGTVYVVAIGLMYLVPALIGIFWGAPLLAREMETTTHYLAWNQSVTRTRWLATKLAIIGGAAAATTGLLSLGVTAWAHRIDDAAGDRITPLVYGARGVVPIGYAIFAFAVGVTAGLLIRRTVPAMAATLATYAAAVGSMPLWIRAHLVPPSHTTPALDLNNLDTFGFGRDGRMRVIGAGPGHAWVLSNQTITPSGAVFTGPANPQFCGANQSPRGCEEWVATLGLRQDVIYHPADHFWSLQWVESGLFLAVAAVLIGFCFWWIRQRRA